jgi:hypothetical protein
MRPLSVIVPPGVHADDCIEARAAHQSIPGGCFHFPIQWRGGFSEQIAHHQHETCRFLRSAGASAQIDI